MASGYSAVINVQVSGLKDVQLLKNRIAEINQLTKSIRPVPSIFDLQRGTSNQAAQVNKAKRELSDLIKKYADGNTTSAKFSSTIAGVNNQLNNFNALAANARIGSEQFTNALKAAANASENLFRKELERLETLRTIYERQPGAGQQDVRAYGPSKLVKDLLAQQTQVPRSVAALEAYQSELISIQRLVGLTSQEFEELAVAIRKVDVQLGRVEFGPQPALGFTSPKSARGGRGPKSAGRLANVALGAGFPLLFGGGPGAVLGGAAGGLVPGPGAFAAQIAFSAIGQQFDQLAAQAVKVGQALSPLNFDLNTFADAAGIAGTETVGFLQKIEEFGGKAAAAKAATELLAARIGTDATKALQKFGSDAQKLGNQLNIIFTTVLANIARIAGPIIAALAANLERGNLVKGFKEREGLTGREAVAQQILGVSERGGGGKGGTAAQIRSLGAQIGLTGTTQSIKEQAKEIAAVNQRTFEQQKNNELELKGLQLERLADAKKGSDDQIKALQKLFEQGQKLTIQYDRQFKLLDSSSDTDRQRLQVQFDFEDRQREISELKDSEQVKNLTLLNEEIQRLENRKVDLEVLKEQLKIFEKIAGIDFSRTEGLGQKAFGKRDIPSGFDPTLPQLAGELSGPEQIAQGLTEKINALKAELEPIKLITQSIVQGATAIGSAFSTAFGEVINGSKTTQEALSDAFKKIGQAFIDMAVEIIAKQITMLILQTALKALGAIAGGGGGPATGSAASGGYTLPPASGGGFAQGFQMPKLYASGGFVTGPTRAMVGEGGESEYIIPASKMAGAMARYSAGARGSNVIPDSSASGGGMSSGGHNTYTLETVVINNVEYATVEQVREFSALAARQGAEGGYNRSMSTLRNSRSQRSRIGLR